VPWAALIDTHGHFLIEHHVLRVAPSLRAGGGRLCSAGQCAAPRPFFLCPTRTPRRPRQRRRREHRRAHGADVPALRGGLHGAASAAPRHAPPRPSPRARVRTGCGRRAAGGVEAADALGGLPGYGRQHAPPPRQHLSEWRRYDGHGTQDLRTLRPPVQSILSGSLLDAET
jgi:hypothetical protein